MAPLYRHSLGQGRCWITTLGRALQQASLVPSPITDITPLPRSNCLWPLCTATLSSRSVTGAATNGTGPDGWLPELDMFPTIAKSCVYGICAFVLRCFFLFSHCTPKWSIVWGLHFFFSSLSSCKCCTFLPFPVFLFCLPRCHMYVVYVWTGWWLISLVLVTSDNKGLLLLLLPVQMFCRMLQRRWPAWVCLPSSAWAAASVLPPSQHSSGWPQGQSVRPVTWSRPSAAPAVRFDESSEESWHETKTTGREEREREQQVKYNLSPQIDRKINKQ